MANSKTQFKSAWFIRKAAYAVVGIVLLVLGGFGVITEDQVESIGNLAANYLPVIVGGAGLIFAAGKTHEGSDSTVTVDDVQRAQMQVNAQVEALSQSLMSNAAARVEEPKAVPDDGNYVERVRGEQ